MKPPGTAFDGNGNVIGLVDMATGTKSATYDYNAFGETIQSDGVASAANHFRFSTKYTDDETGLLYYGLRYYNPTTGRWLSRDPMGEAGGVNLFGFINNDGVNDIDALGLNPFVAAFKDCAISAVKKAATRYIYGILRDSSICNQAAEELKGSKNQSNWHSFNPSDTEIGAFDQRSLATDAVDCYAKKLGALLLKEVTDKETLQTLIKKKISGLKISDFLSGNNQFIAQGKIRIAARCAGGNGELVYIAYWETSYKNFEDRSTGQVLLPLSRRTCFGNNSPLSVKARQMTSMTCAGCSPVKDTDVPSWHPRDNTPRLDGFNRGTPLPPLDE